MFPDAANEKEMDPVKLVTEATLMPLSGLTPGKWELRDACSDGFPGGWSPSFMSTHYRVEYELVVRALELSSTEPACGEGDVQRYFDARAPVWLTNNPGTLSAALADACADASISTGSGKEEEAARLSVVVAAPVAVPQPPTPAAAVAALADAYAVASISTGSGKEEEAARLSLVAAPVAVSHPPTPVAAIVEQPALPKGWAKKGASCTCRVACASGIRAGARLG